MIKRIVKMTFKEESIPEFLEMFEDKKDVIQSFEGCNYLELMQVMHQPNVMFTYSIWDSEKQLNNYRDSGFFKSTWTKTKSMFSEKAEAWSVNSIR